MSKPENIFTRDLDGTGSLHVCRPDDPGAMEFVAIDDETREALEDAIGGARAAIEICSQSATPEQIAIIERHIQALQRLLGRGDC